jgi:hypothetical protein
LGAPDLTSLQHSEVGERSSFQVLTSIQLVGPSRLLTPEF